MRTFELQPVSYFKHCSQYPKFSQVQVPKLFQILAASNFQVSKPHVSVQLQQRSHFPSTKIECIHFFKVPNTRDLKQEKFISTHHYNRWLSGSNAEMAVEKLIILLQPRCRERRV